MDVPADGRIAADDVFRRLTLEEVPAGLLDDVAEPLPLPLFRYRVRDRSDARRKGLIPRRAERVAGLVV